MGTLSVQLKSLDAMVEYKILMEGLSVRLKSLEAMLEYKIVMGTLSVRLGQLAHHLYHYFLWVELLIFCSFISDFKQLVYASEYHKCLHNTLDSDNSFSIQRGVISTSPS